MNNLLVSMTVDAPASLVWDRIGNPGAISTWHPAIAQSPAQGDTRTCVLADGATVHERITHHDPAARTYTYVIAEAPLPVAGYRSQIQVREIDGGRSVVDWSCTFEAVGAPADAVIDTLRGFYVAGLEAVRENLVPAAR